MNTIVVATKKKAFVIHEVMVNYQNKRNFIKLTMDKLMQEFNSFDVYLLHWILCMLKIIIEVICIKFIDNLFSDFPYDILNRC